MLNKILKLLVIVLAICFIILYSIYPSGNCEACSFEIEGKNYNGIEFTNKYAGVCFKEVDINDINLSSLG